MLEDDTAIDIDGRDTSRTRVIVTLIHGNEPSGFVASHRWLRSRPRPATNIRLIIASVTAARQEPGFNHRYPPGEADLNRCFNQPPTPALTARVARIRALIEEVRPEAIVDLHNTSGAGPAFSVALADGPTELALISFFCPTMILTGLRIGSLMEQDFGCPIVTIECGGARDPQAHALAYQGIRELAASDDFNNGHHYLPICILRQPLRVEARPGSRLSYAPYPEPRQDICLRHDIEQRNYGITPAGTCLGWLAGDIDSLVVRDETGQAISHQLFEIQHHRLLTRCDMQIFMATNRTDIALSDCLFYALCLEMPPSPRATPAWLAVSQSTNQ